VASITAGGLLALTAVPVSAGISHPRDSESAGEIARHERGSDYVHASRFNPNGPSAFADQIWSQPIVSARTVASFRSHNGSSLEAKLDGQVSVNLLIISDFPVKRDNDAHARQLLSDEEREQAMADSRDAVREPRTSESSPEVIGNLTMPAQTVLIPVPSAFWTGLSGIVAVALSIVVVRRRRPAR
jgi:hypothetical protein